MNIDVLNLITRVEKEHLFKVEVNFPQENLDEAGILSLKDVYAEGKFFMDSSDRMVISMHLYGIMVLPCSVTLEPVDYSFSVEIEDDYLDLMEEITEKFKKLENSLDISPIIWENILMEIPMKITSEKANQISLEGNGWKLVSDEDEI